MSAFPTVALTFDDGPSAWTPMLLDVLTEHAAHATFFVLGAHIEGHRKTLRRAVQDGHELGIHGWNHKPTSDLKPGALLAQLEMTIVALEGLTGISPRWWRPPWNRADGESAEVAASVGLSWVRVTRDGLDVSRGEESIVATVLDGLTDGAIIGLHDGIAPNGQQQVADRLATVRAVDRILEHCRSVTVSKLLGFALERDRAPWFAGLGGTV